jgi:hypothetical protein
MTGTLLRVFEQNVQRKRQGFLRGPFCTRLCGIQAVLLVLAAAIVISGCSSEEPRGRIAGRVTCQGKPLTEGRVVFINTEKGVSMTARIQPDGTYEVMTAKGAGLPLGEYRVAVCPPPPDATVGVFVKPANAGSHAGIPRKFRDVKTSGLTLTVHDGDNTLDIHM